MLSVYLTSKDEKVGNTVLQMSCCLLFDVTALVYENSVINAIIPLLVCYIPNECGWQVRQT